MRAIICAVLILTSCGGTSEEKCDPLSAAGAGCCKAKGRDACVSGFFCGREEGRSLDTCLKDGSVKGGRNCEYDAQCFSNDCQLFNAQTGSKICRAGIGESCFRIKSDSEDATGCTMKGPPLRCARDRIGNAIGCALLIGTCREQCFSNAECVGGRQCLGRSGPLEGSCSCP